VDAVLIDCDICQAPEGACRDCMMTVLLERQPATPVELDESETTALRALAEAGLVPPLRLVRGIVSGSSGIGRDIA
jgi:hypothetical protein